jgi:Tol biopolymer transport system component
VRFRLLVVCMFSMVLLGVAAGPAVASPLEPSLRGDSTRLMAVEANSSSARILLARGTYIWSCKPDGSDLKRLANAGGDGSSRAAVSWSRDRRSIVFARYGPGPGDGKGSLWRMRADGSAQRKLAYTGPSLTFDCHGLAWSSDGRYIAGGNFAPPARGHVTILDLHTMKSRNLFTLRASVNGIGTISWSPNQRELLVVQEGGDSSWLMRINARTGGLIQNYDDVQRGISSASWAPDGKSIAYAFADLNLMAFGMRIAQIDGTLLRQLSTGHQYGPLWPPSGRQIAYSAGGSVYVMDADGTDRRLIVRNGTAEAWQ